MPPPRKLKTQKKARPESCLLYWGCRRTRNLDRKLFREDCEGTAGFCRIGAKRRPARRRLTSTGSQSHQTKKHPSGCFLFGGRRWIRTIEVSDNRFTVCPLWPLGNSPIYKPNRSWIVLWSWWTASNPRPADYKSAALPAELHQLGFDKCYFIITIYQCQAFF